MAEKNIYLDLDGVILDSEKLVVARKNDYPNLSWNEFFENLNWPKLLKESKEINSSVQIIKELQKIKNCLLILTKVHTLSEMQAKTIEIRENRGIELPIIFVPPHFKKSQIVLPKNNELLIDDNINNINDWNANGGKGVLFAEKMENNVKNGIDTVNSLDFLLKLK